MPSSDYARKTGLGTVQHNLRHDCRDDFKLRNMYMSFDGPMTVEQTLQGVDYILAACGFTTGFPRASDPIKLGVFGNPYLRSISINVSIESVTVHWHGKQYGRPYYVRSSAKDRYALVLLLHKKAKSGRQKARLYRADLRRKREEASGKIASVAETFNDVKLQDDAETFNAVRLQNDADVFNAVKLREALDEGQDCLMTVAN